eukprot:SAG11_NODE_3855_length_2190_cov_0.914873_2_plen_469_part_00
MQDPGCTSPKIVLAPVWSARSHAISTGNRYWFTLIVFIRGDGLVADLDIIFEGGTICNRCPTAAPGWRIATNSTGMSNMNINLESVKGFMEDNVPRKEDGGPSILVMDNASFHIEEETVHAIRDHMGLNMSFPSHYTRLLMPNDNSYNGLFEKYWHVEGGELLQRFKNPPRHEILAAIVQAHKWAKVEVVFVEKHVGEKVVKVPMSEMQYACEKLCGVAPFDANVVLRRQAQEGRTLADPVYKDRDTRLSKKSSVVREERKRKTRTFQEARNLEAALQKHVVNNDVNISSRIMRGVVVADNGEREEISADRFAAFKAFEARQAEKKREDAISTEGHLLSAAQHDNALAAKRQKREQKEQAAAEVQQRKVDRMRTKMQKEMAAEQVRSERLENEKIVRITLKATNFWSHDKEYVLARDMEAFSKANKGSLEGYGDFKSKMTAAERLEFLTSVFNSAGDVEWIVLEENDE